MSSKRHWKVFPLSSLYTMAYIWHPHKFNKIFDTALNFIFPQFSHLLTIHTFQTLVWTQCVCWPGLHSIFPFRKKSQIQRKKYMSLPNPSLARRKWLPEWRITDWKPEKYRNGEKVFIRTHAFTGYQSLVSVLGTSLSSYYKTSIPSFCGHPWAAPCNTGSFSPAQWGDSFLSLGWPPDPSSAQHSQQTPALCLTS